MVAFSLILLFLCTGILGIVQCGIIQTNSGKIQEETGWNIKFCSEFLHVFIDRISLEIPRFTAHYKYYKRALPESRHSAQFPKFPCKGIEYSISTLALGL